MKLLDGGFATTSWAEIYKQKLEWINFKVHKIHKRHVRVRSIHGTNRYTGKVVSLYL
jgi:hypothetical protein